MQIHRLHEESVLRTTVLQYFRAAKTIIIMCCPENCGANVEAAVVHAPLAAWKAMHQQYCIATALLLYCIACYWKYRSIVV